MQAEYTFHERKMRYFEKKDIKIILLNFKVLYKAFVHYFC